MINDPSVWLPPLPPNTHNPETGHPVASPETVDIVLDDFLKPEDELLNSIRSSTAARGLPAIEVSAQQGKMLELLVRTANPSQVLEIGTLAGYSTVCLARGLRWNSDRVTTLEYEQKHADLAREHFTWAKMNDRIEVIVGDAAESLTALGREGRQYDFIFIDADKEGNENYFKWALALGTPDVTIVVDNVIRDGRVIDPTRPEKLAFIKSLARPDVNVSVVQTVGAKGWDGFVLAKRRFDR